MNETESKHAPVQTEINSVRDAVVSWALDPENLGAISRVVDGFQASMTAFARGMHETIPKVLPTLETFMRIGVAMQEAKRREELLADSGWLPHSALPLHRLANLIDPDAVDAEFTAYMKAQWPEVRGNISSRLQDLNVNTSSKNTFMEAMDAHEARLYRCVCRTLMPEIERAVRIDLNGGKLAYPKVPPDKSNPTKMLTNSAGELPFSEVGPGGWLTAILFQRLSEHLYVRIDHDEQKLARFERDPVPNRNATVHGLVEYRSLKSSVNAIFMTDYAFQVISAAKHE